MAGSIQSPTLKFCFHDADEFAQVLNLRRQMKVSQLSLNPFRCDFLLIDCEQIQFSFIDLSCPLRVVGSKGNGYLEFCFLLQTGEQELLSHRVVISQDTMFGFDPTRGVDLVVPANSRICVAQVKQDAFDLCAQAMERNDLDGRFLKTNYLGAPGQMPEVQAFLVELYHLARHRPEFLSRPRSRQLVFEDFLPLLIDSIPFAPVKCPPPGRSPRRMNLVTEAEAYLQTQLEHPPTLMEICKALNTSERPLNYGFQEVFGTSPMAYLKALRLQAVRQRLRSADPTTVWVADIAKQFGFWSLGHFGRDYKHMFGELPSETIRRGCP